MQSSKQRSGITTHSTQHIDCVCVPVLAGVHGGDDGRLDKHHPHTRFQWLGTCSTAAERQARLTGSRSGLLEQPGSSAGESGRLPASTLHQLSLELSLRIPKRVISSLSNLHWQTHVKASWHTKCVSHCNDVYMCNLVYECKLGPERSHQSWSCTTFLHSFMPWLLAYYTLYVPACLEQTMLLVMCMLQFCMHTAVLEAVAGVS